MGFIKKYFSRKIKSNVITEQKFFGSDFDNYLRSRKKYASWAYSCINCRAENVAKAQMLIYSKEKENPNHKFQEIANSTNIRRQSFKLNLFRTVVHLDIYGNAYWLAVRGTQNKPIAFFMLNPQSTQPVLNSTRTYIEKFKYILNSGQVIEYKAEDIIHFMIPSDEDEFIGKSTVSAFNFTLDIEYLQNKFQRGFYNSGALMDLILEHEGKLSDPEFKRLKNEVDEGYRGVKNAGKTLLLEGGTKAKTFQQSMKDVELIPARKNVREEICNMFRVPPVLIGATGTQNKATAIVELMVFNDWVINPFISLFIQEPFNTFIRENYEKTDRIVFENKFIDEDLRIKYLDMMLRHKVLTPQEVALMEGFKV